MVNLLNDIQRHELNDAIIGYLRSQSVDASSIRQLSEELGVSTSEGQDESILERKWAAIVRLQRKIMELEQLNNSLTSESKISRAAPVANPSVETVHQTNTSLAGYLPRFPPKLTSEGHRSRVPCVAFHPKYSLVASGCEDGTIKIWDYEQGEIERTLKAHTRAVHGLCFAPNSGSLVSASADLTLKVWNPDNQFANVRTMLGHDHTVSDVTVTVLGPTNKEYAISASRDKTIRIWELNTGFMVDVLRYHTDWVRTVDASRTPKADSQYILSAGSDRIAILYRWGDMSNPGKVCRYAAHKHVIECCRIAPATSHRFIAKQYPELKDTDLCFATAGRDSRIHIWASSNEEKPIMTLLGHDNWIQGLEFHPSGRFLVSVSDDKTMRIWDLANARIAKTIPAHDHFVSCIAWHNKTIATGSVDQTVKIW